MSRNDNMKVKVYSLIFILISILKPPPQQTKQIVKLQKGNKKGC